MEPEQLPEEGCLSVPRARSILQQGIHDGEHYGAQLSVLLGDNYVDLCVGEASQAEPMRPDHVLCWSSSVKPVMALALAQLEEKCCLSMDDAVAKFVPIFSANGKGGITIGHCLTHMAGLWGTMTKQGGTMDETLSHICAQPLPADWVLGKSCCYDSPAWYVLAAVVKAADPKGRIYETYAQEEIFQPLGLGACSIGMSDDRYDVLRTSGRIANLYTSPALGVAQWKLAHGEALPDLVRFPCPAGNGRGPASELARLYRSLLPCANRRVVSRSAVERVTSIVREGITDELQGTDTPWSLGFAMQSILSGRHSSPLAFGHGGSQSSWAFADPKYGLAVACICNGKPGSQRHYSRVSTVSTAIYEDLALVGSHDGCPSV